jgi:hypothetical protein
MLLPRRTKQIEMPPEVLLGKRVRVSAPTVWPARVGPVVGVDGYVLTVEVSPDLLVAADYEDCSILD